MIESYVDNRGLRKGDGAVVTEWEKEWQISLVTRLPHKRTSVRTDCKERRLPDDYKLFEAGVWHCLPLTACHLSVVDAASLLLHYSAKRLMSPSSTWYPVVESSRVPSRPANPASRGVP